VVWAPEVIVAPGANAARIRTYRKFFMHNTVTGPAGDWSGVDPATQETEERETRHAGSCEEIRCLKKLKNLSCRMGINPIRMSARSATDFKRKPGWRETSGGKGTE
jgi:hypothetical protein